MRRAWLAITGTFMACSVFPDQLPVGSAPSSSDADAGGSTANEGGTLSACPGPSCPAAARLFEESGAHRGLGIVGDRPFWSTSGGGLYTLKFCADSSCSAVSVVPESPTAGIRNYTGYFAVAGDKAFYTNTQSQGYVCSADVTNIANEQCEYSPNGPYRMAGNGGEYYATDFNDDPKGGQAEEGVVRRVTFAPTLPELAELGVSFFARTASLGLSANRTTVSWFEWTDFPTSEHFKVTICPSSLKGCSASETITGTPLQVLVTSGAVYFTYTRGGTNALARVALDGTSLTEIASGLGIEALASDDTHLYWTEQVNPTLIKRCALGGACASETVGTITSPPSFMTAWPSRSSVVFLANDGLYSLALP